jgi:predicted dehydrogenase
VVDVVRVGLVGAGPWAQLFTAPMLQRGPDCTLAAVWARRHDQAERVAGRHGAVAVGSFDELLGTCEAVAFAVPPDVQADLATRAATAGLPVLVEKPLALELDHAQQLADAIAGSGVVSQLVLTNRYRPSMRAFLDTAATFDATAGRATFLGDGAMPGNYFATPWRVERGALLDLGPHVLDVLDAALGTILDVHAAGDPLGVVAVTCTHQSGAISQATLSATTPVDPSGLVVELLGPLGRLALDTAEGDANDHGHDILAAMSTIASEFAAAVRSGVPHHLNVRRGLHLQRLIDAVATCLAR